MDYTSTYRMTTIKLTEAPWVTKNKLKIWI